jgi:hypothetical protein
METWVIVALVLGSNAIMGVVNWLMVKRQLKHSENQLEKQLQAQKEASKRERQQAIRSEPLLKLRAELAHMAAKGERVVDLAKSTVYKVYHDLEFQGWTETEQVSNELTEALDDWNTYMASGEFQQVLFMQYDVKLVERVNDIRDEYNLARHGLNITPWAGWLELDEEAKKQNVKAIEQRIHRDIDVIIRNRERIAEVQSDINKLLEEL